MDIVGTISASIHLAEVIIGQVKKFRDAPKQLQSISETVSFLQRILRQLKETLKPPPGASHAAVRLTKEGEEIGLHATDKCQRILERILTDVLGAELDVKDGTITLGLKGRLTWMVRDSTARELLKELKDAKEDLLLSNSVNQLALAQQSSRVDQEKLDYLTVMAALIFKQRPPENILGERPLGDAPVDIFSPDVPHQPGPLKGLSGGKAGFNSGAPVATTEPLDKRGLKAIDIRQGGITRLKRGHIPDYKLFESRYLRWINDPFDHDFINVYVLDDSSALELRALLMVAEDEQLRLLSEARKSAERRSEEQISEMRILEMRRKEELMRHRRDSLSSVDSLEDSRRDDYAEYSRASDSHSKYSAEDTLKVDAKSELDDGEIVDSLIQRWTLPPAPSATPAPQLAPTPSGRHSRRSSRSPRRKECDVMFNKGDIMYKCHTCAADDYKVFCDDCFNPRYHRGHDIESKKSQHPGDYCDCGHKNAVKREMVCDLHGTIRPDD